MRRVAAGILVLAALAGCMRVADRVASRVQSRISPPAVTVSGAADAPAGVQAELENAVRRGADGVTVIVMRGGSQLFRMDVGEIGPATRYPVASASKWMTAALVMTVVDEGKLSLDAPVSAYLADFQGEAGAITLRQLLAQTSGTGSLRGLVDVRQDPRMTLAESAAAVARRPLEDAPGTVFKYGGPGFQVAGAMAEAVTGRRWAELFDARIARPLGLSNTFWTHLPDRGIDPADVMNPLLQGGVVTTADDYMRFLTMLAEGGVYGERRILSAEAVAAMETVQTLGLPMTVRPRGADVKAQYALGNWCEAWTADGTCTLTSSPGAFGTFPWIDWESGLYGIFFTRDRLPNVAGHFLKARAALIAAYR